MRIRTKFRINLSLFAMIAAMMIGNEAALMLADDLSALFNIYVP